MYQNKVTLIGFIGADAEVRTNNDRSLEGELRSRKYDSTKTNTEVIIWEIGVNSILKLDRAQKAVPEDDEDVVEE